MAFQFSTYLFQNEDVLKDVLNLIADCIPLQEDISPYLKCFLNITLKQFILDLFFIERMHDDDSEQFDNIEIVQAYQKQVRISTFYGNETWMEFFKVFHSFYKRILDYVIEERNVEKKQLLSLIFSQITEPDTLPKFKSKFVEIVGMKANEDIPPDQLIEFANKLISILKYEICLNLNYEHLFYNEQIYKDDEKCSKKMIGLHLQDYQKKAQSVNEQETLFEFKFDKISLLLTIKELAPIPDDSSDNIVFEPMVLKKQFLLRNIKTKHNELKNSNSDTPKVKIEINERGFVYRSLGKKTSKPIKRSNTRCSIRTKKFQNFHKAWEKKHIGYEEKRKFDEWFTCGQSKRQKVSHP